MWLYHRVMSPNDAEGIANSVDPDQTAPLEIIASFGKVNSSVIITEVNILHCLPRHICPKT